MPSARRIFCSTAPLVQRQSLHRQKPLELRADISDRRQAFLGGASGATLGGAPRASEGDPAQMGEIQADFRKFMCV
eukprot:1985320-Pyramimonas_sp.AAC.1